MAELEDERNPLNDEQAAAIEGARRAAADENAIYELAKMLNLRDEELERLGIPRRKELPWATAETVMSPISLVRPTAAIPAARALGWYPDDPEMRTFLQDRENTGR